MQCPEYQNRGPIFTVCGKIIINKRLTLTVIIIESQKRTKYKRCTKTRMLYILQSSRTTYQYGHKGQQVFLTFCQFFCKLTEIILLLPSARQSHAKFSVDPLQTQPYQFTVWERLRYWNIVFCGMVRWVSYFKLSITKMAMVVWTIATYAQQADLLLAWSRSQWMLWWLCHKHCVVIITIYYYYYYFTIQISVQLVLLAVTVPSYT